jgi:hypothetical protein
MTVAGGSPANDEAKFNARFGSMAAISSDAPEGIVRLVVGFKF